ncbi:hypothetical protein SteCoe_2046 [Stentor coeruleus]|uniref:Cilia- and flagella-associated protein 299 n=1 Tax=Stentor coeruleus TaxID=5963 RepID=A0A1R2D0C0_9CILI|nr:hypothetical protein SteCoe_2046 [Stentor coeruleus]
MDKDYDKEGVDSSLDNFDSYEEYLNSHITDTDTYYLEDEELARQLVELGIQGKGEILSKEEFEKRKKDNEIAKKAKQENVPKKLASAEKDLSNFKFLQELADREEQVRNGRLTTIIFIRDIIHKGNKKREISGYIDYHHRLKTENFEDYFLRKKKLLPTPQDLSYYYWDGQKTSINESPNFRVDTYSESGLQFKNKRDRKIINVDPDAETPGDNTRRFEIETDEYAQVVIYDHYTRRKN